MNSYTVFSLLQDGFHITLGATASLIEIFQDSQKFNTTLYELNSILQPKLQEWSQKGTTTEQEAREFVASLFQKFYSDSANDQSTSNSSTPSRDPQTELSELTDKISALRQELEELQKSKSNN